MSNARKNSSCVWKYFTSNKDSTSKLATCNICSKVLSYKSTTSNLKEHIRRTHPTQFSVLVGDSIIESEAGEGVDPVKGHRTAQQSWLWDFFEKVDGKEARCIICQQVYPYAFLSNLKKHLDREHPTLACPDDSDQDEEKLKIRLSPSTGAVVEEDALEHTDGKEDSKSRRKSRVWKFFNRINETKALCKTCVRLYDYSSTTTNLRRHLQRRHPHISWCSQLPASTSYDSSCLKGEKSSADERSDQHESPPDHQFTELYIDGSPQSPSPPPLPPAPAPRQRQHKQQLRQHSRKRGRSRGPRRADSTDSEDGAPRDRRRRRGSSAGPAEDAIDQFGRYVSMLLRRLPPRVANRLQADLVAQIMQAQIECDSTCTTPQVEARRDVETLHAGNHNASDPLPN